jgi:hypothetical protein
MILKAYTPFILELLRSSAKEFVSRAWDDFAHAAAFPGN